MIRILFVDDETSVLEGLQNILHKRRAEWRMSFALGGKVALEELAKGPFDVIVTDMKMPGMDGPALLKTVQEQYPNVARIVLSGQAEREAVLRAVPVTHQFLSKPCDPDVLRTVIERTCNLHTLLSDPALCRVAGRLTRLPSAPRCYQRLCEALNRPDVSLGELADIVEEDPAMTAKVLQLVNSAYFGLAQDVASIHQAVLYLGVDLLRGLLLTAGAFSMVEDRVIQGFSLDHLQTHSFLTARLARRIAVGLVPPDEAFTTSILHDVGHIVLALGMPEDLLTCRQVATAECRPLHEVERERLGVSHAEVGAYLLGVWGLPFSIVEAVAFHHRPMQVAKGARELLAILHAADRFATEFEQGVDSEFDDMDHSFLETGGWQERLAEWRVAALEEFAASPHHRPVTRASVA